MAQSTLKVPDHDLGSRIREFTPRTLPSHSAWMTDNAKVISSSRKREIPESVDQRSPILSL
jgi:hypothetical protein